LTRNIKPPNLNLHNLMAVALNAELFEGGTTVITKMTMVYWKGGKFWLGKLLEHPEIMTQGETLEELEENIKDVFLSMAMEDVPEKYDVKQIAI